MCRLAFAGFHQDQIGQVILVFRLIHFERALGMAERSTAVYQGLLEYNGLVGEPRTLPVSLKDFEAYWESEFDRIGDNYADKAGYATWEKYKQIKQVKVRFVRNPGSLRIHNRNLYPKLEKRNGVQRQLIFSTWMMITTWRRKSLKCLKQS